MYSDTPISKYVKVCLPRTLISRPHDAKSAWRTFHLQHSRMCYSQDCSLGWNIMQWDGVATQASERKVKQGPVLSMFLCCRTRALLKRNVKSHPSVIRSLIHKVWNPTLQHHLVLFQGPLGPVGPPQLVALSPPPESSSAPCEASAKLRRMRRRWVTTIIGLCWSLYDCMTMFIHSHLELITRGIHYHLQESRISRSHDKRISRLSWTLCALPNIVCSARTLFYVLSVHAAGPCVFLRLRKYQCLIGFGFVT